MNFPIDFDEAALMYYDTEQEEVRHEDILKTRMEVMSANRDMLYSDSNYDKLLVLHYGKGKLHPDDHNLPLNKWDETE